jgi:hypothetical protein
VSDGEIEWYKGLIPQFSAVSPATPQQQKQRRSNTSCCFAIAREDKIMVSQSRYVYKQIPRWFDKR